MFPVARPRRLRSSLNLREFVAETSLDLTKLIMPIFVDETAKEPVPIESMPGISRQTLSSIGPYVSHLEKLGIKGILLFGIPGNKDEVGSSSYDDNGVVQKAIALCKENSGLTVIADLCMCEYTSHGHCGILKGDYVDNDATIESYGKIAVSYAKAGVDVIAPSGMMDGQVAFIRDSLDMAGYTATPIMAYSAKYASSMYGPFREAAESTPSFGDRKTYQMDPRNSREALMEISLDIQEGADIVMVKPALPYLDIIRQARDAFDVPIAAYSVSGEYTMIKNSVEEGLLAESAIEEILLSIFRSGADMIITYFAEYLAEKAFKRE